jgi:hypothetical protein
MANSSLHLTFLSTPVLFHHTLQASNDNTYFSLKQNYISALYLNLNDSQALAVDGITEITEIRLRETRRGREE